MGSIPGQEDPHAAEREPGHHNYWAHVLWACELNYYLLQLLKPHLPQACAPQEKPHNKQRTTTRA